MHAWIKWRSSKCDTARPCLGLLLTMRAFGPRKFGIKGKDLNLCNVACFGLIIAQSIFITTQLRIRRPLCNVELIPLAPALRKLNGWGYAPPFTPPRGQPHTQTRKQEHRERCRQGAPGWCGAMALIWAGHWGGNGPE
jgi:hypothetical protein